MSGQGTVRSSKAGALTIFLVAAEESGDRLGAALMRALTVRTAGAVRFVGIGGHEMAAEGLTTLASVKQFAFIGFGGLVRHLPALIRYMRATAAAAVAARPDVLVIIDSPDFTHRIARMVRARSPTIPVVNYVSPSVWAWRPWRARAMRAYVDHVLALLPFEPAALAKLGAPPCSYVGHPLTEQIAKLRPNAEETRRRQTNPPVVLVLPGSRAGEIRRLAPIFGETLERVRDRFGPFEAVLPTVPHLAERVRQATAGWGVPPRIVIEPAEKLSAFRNARAALAKSGTVTLELALAGVPMVTAYRVMHIEAAILRRIALVDTVILANLVAGERFVPEFLQRACTPQNLANALLPLLGDTPERRRQTEMFERFDEIMEIGNANPSQRAAEIVLDIAAPHFAASLAPSSCRDQFAEDSRER
jgi:lipid-A-disaccharide synthase